MRTHSSHCACAPESCVYFPPPLHMQALFCASVLRATSWGSLQASCLRSQRLSANSAPLRATQVHAAVSSDDSGSERHMLTCPGISGRPQKALKKKKSYRKNSSAKFPYREDAFLCLCVCVSFFLLFFSHQFEVWSWFKFEDSNYPAYVCACACVFFLGNICSSLALFSPPLRGPPLSWVLDSLEKRGGQRWRKRNTPAAISVEWILSHRGEISISRFFVYPSPITSSSHTVNIYRGVSSPQLPYRSETGRKKSPRLRRDTCWSSATYTFTCLLLRLTAVPVLLRLLDEHRVHWRTWK